MEFFPLCDEPLSWMGLVSLEPGKGLEKRGHVPTKVALLLLCSHCHLINTSNSVNTVSNWVEVPAAASVWRGSWFTLFCVSLSLVASRSLSPRSFQCRDRDADDRKQTGRGRLSDVDVPLQTNDSESQLLQPTG